MRRPRSGIRGYAGDRLAIELHGQARRQVVRHQDRVRSLRHVDRIVIRQLHEHRQHTDVQVHQVVHALAQHRRGTAAELLPPLVHDDVERLFRVEILPDV